MKFDTLFKLDKLKQLYSDSDWFFKVDKEFFIPVIHPNENVEFRIMLADVPNPIKQCKVCRALTPVRATLWIFDNSEKHPERPKKEFYTGKGVLRQKVMLGPVRRYFWAYLCSEECLQRHKAELTLKLVNPKK